MTMIVTSCFDLAQQQSQGLEQHPMRGEAGLQAQVPEHFRHVDR